MATMIEVKNLTKLYRERAAVDDLSFSLDAGEVLGFLGPNGAGKTTTMRILTGFLPATDGSIQIAGFDVFESPLEVKRRVGYLPEQPPVYLDMTVQDYLAFCARIKGIRRSCLRTEIDRAITATRVDDVRERIIGNLSKGYRQRVGLAQAILGSPKVLILDEPTVGLDPVQIIEVRALIRELARSGEHTIILSTHILHEVTELCQKVLIIKNGQRMGFDTLEGFRNQLVDGRQASLEELYLRLIEPSSAHTAPKSPSEKTSESEKAAAASSEGASVPPPIQESDAS